MSEACVDVCIFCFVVLVCCVSGRYVEVCDVYVFVLR